MSSASRATSTGGVSCEGPALHTLPPMVPMFLICGVPTSLHAVASMAKCSRTIGERAMAAWVTRGTQAEAPVGVKFHEVEFGKLTDRDDVFRFEFTLLHRDDQVGAPGQDPSPVAVGGEERHSLLDTRGLVKLERPQQPKHRTSSRGQPAE